MPHGIRSLVFAATLAAAAGAVVVGAVPSGASSPSVAVSCSSHGFDLGRGGSVSQYTVECSASDASPIDSYTVVSGPSHAAAFTFDDSTGVVDYTAADGFLGVDTVTFTATSGTATSDPATLTFDVANTAPSCPVLGARSVVHDRVLTVNPGCTDAEGDPLTLQSGTVSPEHGGLTVSGAFLRYRPGPGFVGTDRFSFRASDGALASPQQTVTVTVTDAIPVCSAGSVTTTHDRARVIAARCTDADHDSLTATVLAPAQHGSVRVTGSNWFLYKPAKHFLGDDVFTYVVSDGANISRYAAVTIKIRNHVPRLTGVPARVKIRHSVRIRVRTADTDRDGVRLTVARAPHHGRVVISGHLVTYRAHRGFHGTDAFRLRASDGVSKVTRLVRVTVR